MVLDSETPQHEVRHDDAGNTRRSVFLGRLLCVGLLVLTAIWWGIYVFGGRWWIGDVLLNGSVFLGVGLGLVSGVRLFAVRSWRSALVMVVSLSVLMMCLNDRSLLPMKEGGERGPGYVRVKGLNLKMSNEDPESLMRFLETLDDDVVVLVEPQWGVFSKLMNRNDPLSQYPHRAFREREKLITPPMMILSRWGLERDVDVEDWIGVSVVVNRPDDLGGPFRVAGIYAHSPRSVSRWALGNDVVDAYVKILDELNAGDGLPLVIVGDLNGGPMTGRDRALRGGLGVARVSGLFDPRSTFPSKMSMFGLLIDDIWVDGSVEGVSWSTVVIPGSDHRGVRAGLIINGSSGL